MPDISKLEGLFSTQQLIAVCVLAAVLLVIMIGLNVRNRRDTAGSKRSAWRSLVGFDNRASTSRTVALLWTLVVAYCLLTLVLIATFAPTASTPVPSGSIPVGWIDAAFQPLSQSVLLHLGIPVGAAVAAKAVVTHKTQMRTQQKSISGEPARIGQLVSDDDGVLDLVDLQYVLFNVIAALFVLLQFIDHPSRGIGIVPPVFASLTGVSAAIYLGNKLLYNNEAKIDPLSATAAAPGSTVTLTGSNLIVGNATRPENRPKITLSPVDDSMPAPLPIVADDTSTGGTVHFTVPGDLPASTEWKVTVVTNAGSPVTSPTTLRVLPPPTQSGPPGSAWVKRV